MLEVKQVTKTIHGKEILKNISFTIKSGEIALFLGGSGVGKSTLFRVLNQLEHFDSGDLYFNELPLSQKHIGMVFQQFNLFDHLTVQENIELALIKVQHKTKNEARDIACALLDRYGLADKASLPVTKLSGGQKQRLSIARTIALNPKIICLDEPTSALDPKLTSHVAQYIQELAAEGRIVLVTTHDMSLVKQLDGDLYLMENGTVAESCKTKSYFENPENFPLLYRFIDQSSS